MKTFYHIYTSNIFEYFQIYLLQFIFSLKAKWKGPKSTNAIHLNGKGKHHCNFKQNGAKKKIIFCYDFF